MFSIMYYVTFGSSHPLLGCSPRMSYGAYRTGSSSDGLRYRCFFLGYPLLRGDIQKGLNCFATTCVLHITSNFQMFGAYIRVMFRFVVR